ncbi:sensor histidine kinase [Catonella sp.]|uniref:sensor histidine kinase n=1 Tax=Clostridia TaxID=186801 RepID=UPI003F9FC8AD
MKTKKINIILYLVIFLFCAIGLIAINLIILYSQVKVTTFDEAEIINNIKREGNYYTLSEQTGEMLTKNNNFLMLLNDDGIIILSKNLPEELNKQYSLKDVAAFTRYYLKDYPVQTYIIDEGLLIIGEPKNTEWKYNLVYKIDTIQNLSRILPLIIFINILILVLIPLYIQKRVLRRKESDRTEWIAGVSHDIRTPLTLIMGHADQIRKDPQSEKNRIQAEIIEKQGERIRNMVANLNVSSKLDFGLDHFENTSFKVGSKTRKILIDIMNREFEQKYKFDFEIEEDASNIILKVNESLFQRVIENIINNSIHHNPNGCSIKIKISKSIHRSHKFTIEFSDDGIGVSAEQLKKLNTPVLNNLENAQEHGIGLRIVKQIARYYKWSVQFSTSETSGMKVVIEA